MPRSFHPTTTTHLTTPPSQAPPTLLRFTVNRAAASPDDEVVFTAVLTDPDGIDDLIGGVLEIDGTDVTVGSFATSAQEGAYSLSVSGHLLGGILPAEFVETRAVQFVGRFYDAGGQEVVSEPLEVEFGCRADEVYCDGRCMSEAAGAQQCTTSEWICLGLAEFTNCNDYCGVVGSVCLAEIETAWNECEPSGRYRHGCTAEFDWDVEHEDDFLSCLCLQR